MPQLLMLVAAVLLSGCLHKEVTQRLYTRTGRRGAPRGSATCQPTVEKLVAGACNRLYRRLCWAAA